MEFALERVYTISGLNTALIQYHALAVCVLSVKDLCQCLQGSYGYKLAWGGGGGGGGGGGLESQGGGGGGMCEGGKGVRKRD